MSIFLEQCFQKMNQGEVIAAYKGNIDSTIISRTLEDIELKLEEFDVQNLVKKKLYNVLVEALQNLYHHVDTPQSIDSKEIETSNFGIFTLNKQEEGFKISTGNFILKDRVDDIKGRIDKINSLSAEELKKFYKLVLNNQQFSEKGGGGLGLIDMARKTGNNLKYDFFDYNDKFLFFSLTLFINF